MAILAKSFHKTINLAIEFFRNETLGIFKNGQPTFG